MLVFDKRTEFKGKIAGALKVPGDAVNVTPDKTFATLLPEDVFIAT